MLSTAHLRGIESRGISVELAADMGLYSAKRLPDGSVRADANGNVLCFPTIVNGIEVNTKYRWVQDGEKRFSQVPGGRKEFFNVEVLLDEATLLQLEAGSDALIITEGEFDAIATVQAGFPITVSVPDGAPPARRQDGTLIEVPEDTDDLDPANDVKFSYIGSVWKYLERVKYFIIAVDNDEPGQRLSKELARRLGPARCSWVEYPEEPIIPDPKAANGMRRCKDLNEVLQYFGEETVREVIEGAKPWPVKGLFKFKDFPDTGDPVTYRTGLSDELDQIFRPYPGAFVVATGVPNMGKSEIIKQVAVNMAKMWGWPTVMFPGEEPVKPYLENSLKTKFLGKHKDDWTPEDNAKADAFLDRYFEIVANNPREDEEEITLDYLLDKAATSVFRNGTKLLVIDPWNELEHQRDKHWSLTEYVGDAIRKLKRFARGYDVCVIVVAHPKKIDGCPGLYDISDSAHWANKADLGLVVHSDEPTETLRDVIVTKARFKAAGRKGAVPMEFDRHLEMYVPVGELGDAPMKAAA